MRCDHRDDAQVAAVFARVLAEQSRIDVLVNNASAAHLKACCGVAGRSGRCRPRCGTT